MCTHVRTFRVKYDVAIRKSVSCSSIDCARRVKHKLMHTKSVTARRAGLINVVKESQTDNLI